MFSLDPQEMDSRMRVLPFLLEVLSERSVLHGTLQWGIAGCKDRAVRRSFCALRTADARPLDSKAAFYVRYCYAAPPYDRLEMVLHFFRPTGISSMAIRHTPEGISQHRCPLQN